jgi:hypothetical protein
MENLEGFQNSVADTQAEKSMQRRLRKCLTGTEPEGIFPDYIGFIFLIVDY